MVTARLIVNDKERSLCLKVKGHAGQAEIGHDIICASASILAYTVAQIVTDMKEKAQLDKEPTIVLNSGDATVSCICKDDNGYADALNAYYVAMVGYQLLAHNYPQFVEYKIVGEVE